MQKKTERADYIFKRDVLRIVDEAVTTLHDFSSLNQNYIDNVVLMEEANKFFAETELPGIKFDLQSSETISLEGVKQEDMILGIVQIIIGLFDIQENTKEKYGQLQVERKSVSETTEELEVIIGERAAIKCQSLTINAVITANSEILILHMVYANTFYNIEQNNSPAIGEVIFEIEGETEIFKILYTLTLLNDQWLRFKFYDKQGIEENNFNKEQFDILEENARDWLNYTSYTFNYRFMFAILDMTREQLVSIDTEAAVNNHQLSTNILMLNKQIFELQKAVDKLPYIFEYNSYINSGQTLSWIQDSQIDNAHSIIKMDINMRHLLIGPTYERKGRLSIGEASGPVSSAIIIPVQSGVTLRTNLYTSCTIEESHAELFAKTYSSTDLIADILSTCKFEFTNILDVFFSGATQVPYDVDTTNTLSLNLTLKNGEDIFIGEASYGDPVPIAVEQLGVYTYGLRYTQINTNAILIKINKRWVKTDMDLEQAYRKPCSKNAQCYIINNHTSTIEDFKNLEYYFSDFPTPVFRNQYQEGIWNTDDLTRTNAGSSLNPYNFELTIAYDETKSSNVFSVAKVSINRNNNGYPFSQQNSLNILAFQLNSLANDVQQLEDRIENLENVVYQNNKGFFWFIQSALSIVDIAFNVAELGKSAVQISTASFSAMKRPAINSKNPLAAQFKAKHEKSKQTASYSIVDSVEAASQVSYLQGHNKRYFKNDALKTKKIDEFTIHDIVKNKQDFRELSELNPTIYAKMQSEFFDSISTSNSLNTDFTRYPFGCVSVHKSPIDVPIGKPATKFLSKKTTGTQAGRSFLSNDQQRFPFHTSVSSVSVEIRSDDRIVLNTRFTGVAEPSVIGPTNAKNPRVKVGYIKIQHEIITDPITGKSTLHLLPWQQTEIVPGTKYQSSDVDGLFTSFFPKQKQSSLTTDEKWQLIAFQTSDRINTRNVIDSVPLQSNIFFGALDDLMFFSKNGDSFKYNLLNNNCQTYAKAFAQMATVGSSNMDLVASDFRAFSLRVADFAQDYFRNSPAMQLSSLASKTASFFTTRIHQFMRVVSNTHNFIL